MTMNERLKELVAEYGSMRAVGRALNIDHGYLSRLATMEKVNPSKAILKKLGIRGIIDFERVK